MSGLLVVTAFATCFNSVVFPAFGEEAAILYGSFLQNILDFLIIGVCMFFMIKTVAVISSRLRHEEEAREEAPAPAGPTQEELLAEIRDLLKERRDIA